MNGRTFFKKFSYVVVVLSKTLSLPPKFILVFLLDVLSLFPSKIGVLLRYIVLKAICPNIGSNIYIGRFVVFKNFIGLSIGNNVSIHDYSYIDAIGGVEIGNDVSIAHSSSIISFEHIYDEIGTPIKYSGLVLGKIKVENDVWIGCGVRVLSNSHIKNRTIIAAGSVVRGHLESSSVYAGVPVRKVKGLK